MTKWRENGQENWHCITHHQAFIEKAWENQQLSVFSLFLSFAKQVLFLSTWLECCWLGVGFLSFGSWICMNHLQIKLAYDGELPTFQVFFWLVILKVWDNSGVGDAHPNCNNRSWSNSLITWNCGLWELVWVQVKMRPIEFQTHLHFNNWINLIVLGFQGWDLGCGSNLRTKPQNK